MWAYGPLTRGIRVVLLSVLQAMHHTLTFCNEDRVFTRAPALLQWRMSRQASAAYSHLTACALQESGPLLISTTKRPVNARTPNTIPLPALRQKFSTESYPFHDTGPGLTSQITS